MEDVEERKTLDKSVFPLVYVQVRQWGAWKLHPSNSVTQKLFLIAQYGTNLKTLEVMRVLINAPYN